ncbi:hypothetical protein [Mycobacteroides salmoniphilum]|uniref:hypothetical protein n=1 Tax=Mycobacteroides salmoniphilum TaxID=404941 RepID=UPI000993A381|nr:hypothetical protein [Mycobacteroides salmoniphilum]
MTEEELEALGQMVSKAEWKTPKHSTYRMADHLRQRNKRLNDIAVGRSLMLLIHDSDLTLYGSDK